MMDLKSGLIGLVMCLLVLIIPTNCTLNVHLRDYDLLVLTGGSSVLLMKNTSSPHEVILPKVPETRNATEDAEKHPVSYTSVAADMQSNTLYFTTGSNHIAFLNLTSGSSGLVYSTDSSLYISDLTAWNSSVYWIEDERMIKSIEYNKTITLMNESGNGRIQGLALNPKSGLIYYTFWPKIGRTSEIRVLNGTENGTVLKELPLPRYVFTDGDSMAWANNPPGIYFTIEVANVQSLENHTVVWRQGHDHVSSLTMRCGKVYWTDVLGKRLWVVDTRISKSKFAKSTQISIPGYSFLLVQALSSECDMDLHEVVITTPEARSEEASNEVVISTARQEPPEQLVPVTGPPPNNPALIRFCNVQETRDISCNSGICLVLNSHPTCLYDSTPAPSHLSSSQRDEESPYNWPTSVVVIISVLATVAVIMILFSAYMIVRVRSLTLKPIIRRRVVVSRRTSESSHSTSPTSVCEMIDIENCCNMNVCETPCYERTLLPSSSPNTLISVNSSNQNWSNKTDKSCLLK